jgi:hypothetical protein
MNLIFLGGGDRREGRTIAGGVMESGIARIAVFLWEALDRAAKVTTQVSVHEGSCMTASRWWNIRQVGVC